MKNKINFLILVSAFCCLSVAQKRNDAPVNEQNNVVKIKPVIYLLGGIASVIGQREHNFAKKYNISFYDFGCLAPINLEEYEVLNGRVFELLTIQFGPKWQTEIHPNTLGFAKWKENNK